jgi:predicted metal-dependent hydrolase
VNNRATHTDRAIGNTAGTHVGNTIGNTVGKVSRARPHAVAGQLGFAFEVESASPSQTLSTATLSPPAPPSLAPPLPPDMASINHTTHSTHTNVDDPVDITPSTAHVAQGVVTPPVQVTRSKRSRKTVSARYRDGIMHVTIPWWMSATEEQTWVANMQQRFARANRKTDTALMDRAAQLARQYKLPLPASVVWTRELTSRWGSCTIDTASIRINGKLASAPSWVVDYVLVHELAHLVHADHSPAFWDVVNRYPKAERSIGFLMGMGLAEG